jgi:hypothetical protein
MNANVDKSLVYREEVLDNVPESFPFIALKVIPANAFQTSMKRPLHGLQLFARDEARQHHNSICFQFGKYLIDGPRSDLFETPRRQIVS